MGFTPAFASFLNFLLKLDPPEELEKEGNCLTQAELWESKTFKLSIELYTVNSPMLRKFFALLKVGAQS